MSIQDPTEVLDEYGADALRLYLINSPVVRGETLRFKKEGVFAVVKDVFLPWYNAYRFLVQNVLRLQQQTGITFEPTKVSSVIHTHKNTWSQDQFPVRLSLSTRCPWTLVQPSWQACNVADTEWHDRHAIINMLFAMLHVKFRMQCVWFCQNGVCAMLQCYLI